MSGIAKSVSLRSADVEHWSAGTRVEVSWLLERHDGSGGAYRASDVTVVVFPDTRVPLRGIDIHLLERDPRTGVLVSDIRRRLTPRGNGYETVFDWNSSARIPEQELHVSLETELLGESDVRLKDPISRRFNFLVKLAGD
jgi:hypothetical protein